MSRLKGRIEAAESKAGIGRENDRITLFFVEGWPEDGASEFVKEAGHDLSRPHRIVCFVPAKDGKPVATPLKDVTEQRNLRDQKLASFQAWTETLDEPPPRPHSMHSLAALLPF